MNEEYLEICESINEGRDEGICEAKVLLYQDFGDVRFQGDKYKAFTDWWCTKLSQFETRGTHLFAEPILTKKVSVIDDAQTASLAANDVGSLLINIPNNLTRKQIDMSLDRIFRKELVFEKGRQTRNPSRSSARYKLSKPVKAESLKSAFDIIEAEREALVYGIKLSNMQLADKVGLKVEVSEATKTEQKNLAEYQLYLLSTTVSRKKRLAKTAIANTMNGIFP